MARQPMRLRKGRKMRASTAALCGGDPLHDAWSHASEWRESNQDGRMESSLMCPTRVTSSTWAQREACTRFEQSDVARPQNELIFAFLSSVSARPWDGPKKVRDVPIVLPDVSSPAAMAEAEAIGKGRRLYISKADLMKHGLTEGCLGCRCLAEGK